MKVDQLGQAQTQLMSELARQGAALPAMEMSEPGPTAPPTAPLPYPLQPPHANDKFSHLYPALGEYMGLEFTPEILAANMPEYMPVAIPQPNTVATPQEPGPPAVPSAYGHGMVAPLSGQSVGLQRAQVHHGIREITACKDASGKIGVRVKSINKGIFVCLVQKNSPASLAGLRFGDQILQINGETVAGYSMEKVHDIFKKCSANGITVAIRDRPFERTVTLHKDSAGHIGFQFRDGEITALVKDSSAARNGLLIDHHLLEVNGQNVVGLKDKEISGIIGESGQVITVTIMPSFIYKHMMKHMASSLVTKFMDHSIPDL